MQYDFTSWIGVMFVVGMVLFLFGISAIVVASVAPKSGYIMYLVYAGLAALVFSVVRLMRLTSIIRRAVSGHRRANGNRREEIRDRAGGLCVRRSAALHRHYLHLLDDTFAARRRLTVSSFRLHVLSCTYHLQRLCRS